MVQIDGDASRDHRIPPPDGTREPRKVNVFEQMQHANTQLIPLFPYYGPGAIVYSGAIFRGGQHRPSDPAGRSQPGTDRQSGNQGIRGKL